MADVKYEPRAKRSTAFALIAEGWNELVQGSYTVDYDSLPAIKDHTEILYVQQGTEVIGFLAYNMERTEHKIEIVLAYVEPTSRRQGHFRMMLAHLRNLARNADIDQITVAVSPANKTMAAVLKAVKAEPLTITYDLGGM